MRKESNEGWRKKTRKETRGIFEMASSILAAAGALISLKTNIFV
jgi:hypothetical protein